MKPRKWILIVFVLILFTSGGFYVGKLFVEKNRNLENLFVNYISPLFGGRFNVKKVSIGFFAIYLNEVELSIPLQYYSLSIENIKIGFSFFQFLKTKGDIKKSINKIIFVNPVVTISFSHFTSKNIKKISFDNVWTVPEFPVQHILIKNCSIWLKDYSDGEMIIGEQLNGKIWVLKKDIKFELNGKLAAKKQNLFISGLMSNAPKERYLSIRLDKARIIKPIILKDISLLNGEFDGICKVSFSDTCFPYNICTQGALEVTDGVVEMNGVSGNIEDVMAKVTFVGSSINLDSISAQWNGVKLLMKGYTGLFQKQGQKITLQLDGLEKKKFPQLPQVLFETVSGKGWFEIDAEKGDGDDTTTAKFSFGGFSIQGEPLRCVFGECSFRGGRLSIDTACIDYSYFSVGVNGIINYKKTPFDYSFTLNSSTNAENILDEFHGTVEASADIHGTENNPDIKILLNGNELKYDNISLGSPAVSMRILGDSISFRSIHKERDEINLEGKVYNITTNEPSLLLHTQIGNELVIDLLKKYHLYNSKIITKATVDATVKGTLADYQVAGTLFCDSELLKGKCQFDVIHADSSNKYIWLVKSDSLSLNAQPFEFNGTGNVSNAVINVDAFSVLDYISANGTITLGEENTIVMECNAQKISYNELKRWFPQTVEFIEKGFVKFNGKITGAIDNPDININLSIEDCSIAGISTLETNAVVNINGQSCTVLPFVVRKNKKVIIVNDTLKYNRTISSSGTFVDINIDSLLPVVTQDDWVVSGIINGQYWTSPNGFPVNVRMKSDELKIDTWGIDSVTASVQITQDGILIDTISCVDSIRLRATGNGTVPWSFLHDNIKEGDTLCARLEIKGDILKSIEHNVQSPIGGSGLGEIVVDFCVNSEQWYFNQAYAYIPKGTMTITPFVPDGVKDMSLKVSMDNNANLSMNFSGSVNNRPVTISTSHIVPKGHKSIFLGQINCGVLQVRTPKKGIHLFLPGFMENEDGNNADIEFAPKDMLQTFTISGPVDRLRISGTWIIRSAEFTFPFIDEEPPPEDDPFPYITWDLDLKAGNRKLFYFYNLGRKSHKFIRFVECVVDPSTSMSVVGRDADGTFRLLGSLRSYKGYVFYGKSFDRNFTLGIDFSPQKLPGKKGYNNLPIIWGSAETFSDSSRYDRIKLTLLTRDSTTGVLREKGRFSDITFRISSNFEEIPGESEKDFYRSAGLNFITIKGAGEVVSGFSDQYIKKYLFQRFERKLASRLGLDVISFETSIASNYFNYFYNFQNNEVEFSKQWNYLTFANVGITLGRYFLRDKVFVKWRTELIPNNLVLTPEHSVGFEYQPVDFFWIDFNYAMYKNNDIIEYNPKLLMQLRIPINAEKFRNIFNFKVK